MVELDIEKDEIRTRHSGSMSSGGVTRFSTTRLMRHGGCWSMLVVWTPWTPPGMPTAQALDQKRITYFRLKRVEYDGDLDQEFTKSLG